MNDVIMTMLSKYNCQSRDDYENALKEIIQEVALLGLWRSKFFEHALFYGGTALRILYGLDRFSEDLDFSLLVPDEKFQLKPYLKAIETELTAFGFSVSVTGPKEKAIETPIDSAFIKASTKIHLLQAKAPPGILQNIQGNTTLKIKVEIDTSPPQGFRTEVKNLFQPIAFQVKTMALEDLFAGKLSAIIGRSWKGRVKGRDYYDLIWYIGRGVPCHLEHLQSRLTQFGYWDPKKTLTREELHKILIEKIQSVDFEMAKRDVSPFLKDQSSLSLWDQSYFIDVIQRIK